MIEVLFGSRNRSKTARMQALFETLGIALVPVRDDGLPEPDEGDDVETNARIKAAYYAEHGAAPCIASDYGLELAGLGAAEQPAAHVRRIGAGRARVSDAEALAFYCARITALGGRTDGTWTAALAIAFTPSDVVSVVASHTRPFVDRPCSVRLPGEPLASLQIDIVTGLYVAERAFTDRARSPSPIDQAFLALVRAHLERLRTAVRPH
jgi:hypothetical protein